MIKRIFFSLLLLSLLLPITSVQAQDATPVAGPVYIIQPGDSLSLIASRFGVTLAELMAANNMTDANNISAGAKIIIPGLEGISGVLTTEMLNYGETLHSLSRRNGIPETFLRRLNHITSPSELYAGVSVVLPKEENATPLTQRLSLAGGDTLLEAAVRAGTDPWALEQVNGLAGTWDALPGDILYSPIVPADAAATGPTGMPGVFASIKIDPLPMAQGSTTKIIIQTQPGVTLGGMLVDRPLHFFKQEDGSFVALQGVHAMLPPGPYPLELNATLPDGSQQSFAQMIVVQSGNYPEDPMLTVDPETIDPAITGPEDKQIATMTTPVTPDKQWSGIFQIPVGLPYCLKSRFGNRRAYNGGDYLNFHAGLDFGICSGDHPYDIYAPADGTVIFTGQLTVRGNATIIDHGWGIYTGYWHQEKILVNVGDKVKTGDLIGQIGETGRVTGPHLHWEVWVNGIQVDPLEWLNNVYP